jgi:non-lysosomal glucosylceramidase
MSAGFPMKSVEKGSVVRFCKRKSMMVLALCAVAISSSVSAAAWGQARIPDAAWKRPLGLPLENPGKTRTPGDIDDGYWQGAPV